MSRRPVVYHIINAGRRPMATASELITEGKRVAVELAPEVVGTRGVFVYGEPLRVGREAAGEEMEEARRRVEAALSECGRRAAELVGDPGRFRSLAPLPDRAA